MHSINKVSVLEAQNILSCIKMLYNKCFIMYLVEDFSIIESNYLYNKDNVTYMPEDSEPVTNCSLLSIIQGLLQTIKNNNNFTFHSNVLNNGKKVNLFNEVIKWFDINNNLRYIILISEENSYLKLNPYSVILNKSSTQKPKAINLTKNETLVLRMYLQGLTYTKIAEYITNTLNTKTSIKMVGEIIREKIHPLFKTTGKIELLEKLTTLGYTSDWQ